MKKGKIKSTDLRSRRFKVIGIAFLCGISGCSAAFSDTNPPLPDPLTLSYALSLVDENHPDLAGAEAEYEEAVARKMKVLAQTDMEAKLSSNLRWVKPSDQDSLGEGLLGFVVGKSVYDFGRTRENGRAAEADIQQYRQLLLNSQYKSYLQVMEFFFDVLVADLRFARDNEAMAVAYVSFDRLKDRHELGQVSDIDVLEAESEYMKVRRQRIYSESMQRLTRARLANAINRPGELSSNLTEPVFSGLDEKSDLEQMTAAAARNNPKLLALQNRMEKEEARMQAIKSEYWPTIKAQMEVGEYTRDLPSRDQWSVGIVVDIPVYQGNRIRSERMLQRAKIKQVRAQHEKLKTELNQTVLQLWFEAETLRAQLQEMRKRGEFQDLYLDRARALYDLEYKTDLGDAMVKSSDVRLGLAQTRYKLALAQARLLALTGRNPGKLLVIKK